MYEYLVRKIPLHARLVFYLARALLLPGDHFLPRRLFVLLVDIALIRLKEVFSCCVLAWTYVLRALLRHFTIVDSTSSMACGFWVGMLMSSPLIPDNEG